MNSIWDVCLRIFKIFATNYYFRNIFICVEELNYMKDFIKVKITKIACKVTKAQKDFSELSKKGIPLVRCKLLTMGLKLHIKGIPTKAICQRYFSILLKKRLVLRALLVVDSFLLTLKTILMCLKLNRNSSQTFFVRIISSPKIWRYCL